MAYSPFNLPQKVLEYINRAGAGSKGAHRVITNAAEFVGDENHFAYLIKVKTDAAEFTTLEEESGINLPEIRRNCGTQGYSNGDYIPGRFVRVKPTGAAVVELYVVNNS